MHELQQKINNKIKLKQRYNGGQVRSTRLDSVYAMSVR